MPCIRFPMVLNNVICLRLGAVVSFEFWCWYDTWIMMLQYLINQQMTQQMLMKTLCLCVWYLLIWGNSTNVSCRLCCRSLLRLALLAEVVNRRVVPPWMEMEMTQAEKYLFWEQIGSKYQTFWLYILFKIGNCSIIAILHWRVCFTVIISTSVVLTDRTASLSCQ